MPSAPARPWGGFNAARRRAASGFTIVELITVLVVMGILGAVAIARFFDNGPIQAREFADQAKAVIRYGQKLAIAQNRPIYVSATGNRFALCVQPACAAGSLVTAPGGNNRGTTATKAQCQTGGSYVSSWMCEGKPDGLTVACSRATEVGPNGMFFFDAMGRPYNAADAANPLGTASTFTTPLTVTFSAGTTSVDVTVEAETGYVH
ncbi:MAG TPA: type II secretion system protein [Burkholderiaceae bacterium]|nr:type II secretion system protein [Burkholderiaceae bacterium]